MYDYEKEHLQLLRSRNAECTLFLKRNGDFPMPSAGDLALYGSGARNTVKGGTGSGEVNSRFFTTAEQGLRDAGFRITTGEWMDSYDGIREKAFQDFAKEIRRRAKETHMNVIMASMGATMPEPDYDLPVIRTCDTAVYVLARNSGEGNDRKFEPGDVELTKTEVRDILKLQALYSRFLLVLNVGGPVDLTPVAPQVENILLLSQLGTETGAVLADILLGKAFPSGKLATTWSASSDYCTLGDFGCKEDTHYSEGIYVGYRYFDSVGKKAMYPFGFGLGYTDFRVLPGEVTLDGEQVCVHATVENIGSLPGQEVVQVYVSCPEGELDQPYQTLAAFGKSGLVASGGREEVIASFALRDVASYDEKRAAWVLEAGDYVLRVGNSSVSTEAVAVLRLSETVVTEQVKNALGKPEFQDWKPAKLPAAPVLAPVLEVDASAISAVTPVYGGEPAVDPLAEALTDEELALLGIGAFDPKGGIGNVVGSAGVSVAGAAGETCGSLKDKGFPVMVMADGPAGVRISRQYYVDEKGVHGIGQSLPESMLSMLPGLVKRFMTRPPRLKKGTEIREQYATAIPIGTAIAQSFNVDYARMCGDLVGSEMARFGVHLWLAPALNIHRSILCGRNFEYYSEDPLVSGLMAAAITQGVQSHPGCGTTIKHFAANNQETNRYNSNSHVSERAMREIYLRGFGICVRRSQPAAVMTSYNLINGVHTSESRELTEDILRSEFGFRGIVMTDWVVGGPMLYNSKKYPMPNAGKVAKAGGDLFMPGSKGDYKRSLELLRAGELSRHQLEVNATRILHMAQKLTKK